MPVGDDVVEKLIREARVAAERAHAPYSKFRVGAALLCAGGEIVAGCNVENASLGLTVCAERNAVFAAVARGVTRFEALAIAAPDAPAPAPPCGACRQVLREFVDDLPIVSVARDGCRETWSLRQLLPHAFHKF